MGLGFSWRYLKHFRQGCPKRRLLWLAWLVFDRVCIVDVVVLEWPPGLPCGRWGCDAVLFGCVLVVGMDGWGLSLTLEKVPDRPPSLRWKVHSRAVLLWGLGVGRHLVTHSSTQRSHHPMTIPLQPYLIPLCEKQLSPFSRNFIRMLPTGQNDRQNLGEHSHT